MQAVFTRPPEEWATGWEPMTPAQRLGLINMALYRSMDVPFLFDTQQDGQNVTKAEASALIEMLKEGGRPSMEYLNSLGRHEYLLEPPPHPHYWHDRHGEPSGEQRVWINQLGTTLGIPMNLIQEALANVTRGQASLLIGRLRQMDGQMGGVVDRSAWFENEVREVEGELPHPIEVAEDSAEEDTTTEVDTEDADYYQHKGPWSRDSSYY
ncbi:hypothetical protein GY45DRAFT_1437695 [Cubamyces sp. BRFM 1775]|nr:hypothetical protein GY45DRAFT_1437695 [Cubamyces sp. BRFM 1775]